MTRAMPLSSGGMAAQSIDHPQVGDRADRVFAWMNAVLKTPDFLEGPDDLIDADQKRYRPLDIDAVYTLYSHSTTKELTPRGHSITGEGKTIWIDNDYRVVAVESEFPRDMLANAVMLISELRQWGYPVTHDSLSFHPARPNTVLIEPKYDHLEITRWAPTINGQRNSEKTKIHSLAVEGIGDQLCMRWAERDRQIPDNAPARKERILKALRDTIRNYFKDAGYEPWEFTVDSIDPQGSCCLLYEVRAADLKMRRHSIWFNIDKDQSEPYVYKIPSEFREHFKNERKLDAMIEEHGGIRMTSLTKSILDHGGLINRNSKGVVTAKKRVLNLGRAAITYTIRQPKGRLEADVSIRGETEILLGTGTYLIKNVTLPESALAAISGTPLVKMVEHPLIPDDVIITSARNTSDGIRGEIRGETTLWKTGSQRLKKLTRKQEKR